MLRMNGRALVRAAPSDQQVEVQALAGGEGMYAIRAVKVMAITPDTLFNGADLRDEVIEVVSEADGHRMLLARVASFPQAKNSFALSPDGRQLGVLTATEVELYPVPSDKRR